MLKGFMLTGALLACGAAMACDMEGHSGIVEDNNLYIPANNKAIYTVSEAKFNQILDKVEGLYAPVIAAKGKTLKIERKWDDGTVNAYAQQQGSTWMVSMFGGLARHETITEDAFALVACHELGHHLGGAPKKASYFGATWASNEGQADYYGNSKCLRNYMQNDDNVAIVANMEVDEYAKEKCETNFHNEKDIAICIRGAMAGLSLGNLFRALRRLDTPLGFKTPDTSTVSRTNDNHPAPQCRVDTYFAGAICEKDFALPVSDRDADIGVCNRHDGHTDGVRPLCWFKPSV